MANTKFEKSGGALFPEKNRKSEKSPTSTGYIELNDDLINEIIAKQRAGEPVKLRISAWKREGQKGAFLSMAVEMEGAYKGASQAASSPTPVKRQRDDFEDSDIPF